MLLSSTLIRGTDNNRVEHVANDTGRVYVWTEEKH